MAKAISLAVVALLAFLVFRPQPLRLGVRDGVVGDRLSRHAGHTPKAPFASASEEEAGAPDRAGSVAASGDNEELVVEVVAWPAPVNVPNGLPVLYPRNKMPIQALLTQSPQRVALLAPRNSNLNPRDIVLGEDQLDRLRVLIDSHSSEYRAAVKTRRSVEVDELTEMALSKTIEPLEYEVDEDAERRFRGFRESVGVPAEIIETAMGSSPQIFVGAQGRDVLVRANHQYYAARHADMPNTLLALQAERLVYAEMGVGLAVAFAGFGCLSVAEADALIRRLAEEYEPRTMRHVR